jgi:hypothetical protein
MKATERGGMRESNSGVSAVGGWLLAGSMVVLSVCIGAFPAAADQAEEILDHYIVASGGEEAHARIQNRVTVATLEPVGSGLKLAMTTYSMRPSNSYTVIENEVIGKIEQGCNGEVAWEISAMRGSVVKEGKERDLLIRSSNYGKDIEWRKWFDKVEFAGIDTVEGRACHKVVMTPRAGDPETRYFDQETNLLTKIELELDLPGGRLPVKLFLSDYRETEGVLSPFKTRRLSGGQEILITVESIQSNVEMSADRFALPEDIQKLIDEQEAGAEESGGS